MPQVAEDVLEELERHLLRLGDPLALDRSVGIGGGQLDAGSQCVVVFGGDAHVSILTLRRDQLSGER